MPYWVKEAWADGSKCVTFEPLDFVAKLVPLIPPPRANLIRYYGAWASHAAIRKLVVPMTSGGTGHLALPLGRGTSRDVARGAQPAAKRDDRRGGQERSRERPDRISWSELAKRAFDVDVKQCARCGHSPVRVVAVVAAPTREQLEVLGARDRVLSTRPERSRAPPSRQLLFAFAPAAT